ncbi:hypothetical protein ACFLU8_00750 [Chloroflexota bacterium]
MPAVKDIVRVNGRVGIVFERIEGHSMREKLISRPSTLFRSAYVLADLHATMHSCEVSGLPSQRQRLESTIRGCASFAI